MRFVLLWSAVLAAGVARAEAPKAKPDFAIVDKLCKLVVEGRPKMSNYIEAVGGKVTSEVPGTEATGELVHPTFHGMYVHPNAVGLAPNPSGMPHMADLRAAWPKEKLVPIDKPDRVGRYHIVLARPGGKKPCRVTLELFTGKNGVEDGSLGSVEISR